MNKLPLLAKNAYLKILITKQGLYSRLVYSHYDINKCYFLSDFTRASTKELVLKTFWDEFFIELQKEFDWKLINYNEGFIDLLKFEEEFQGIGGVSVYIQNPSIEVSKFLNVEFPFIEVFQLDDKINLQRTNLFCEKFGYTDVLWIEANVEGIKLSRVLKPDLNRNKESVITYSSSVSSNEEIVKLTCDSRLQAFLSESNNQNTLVNYWINYLERGTLLSNNVSFYDVWRAILTINLLTATALKPRLIDGFGMNTVGPKIDKLPSAIMLTGSLSELFKSSKPMLFALLDGLQLEGIVDIFIDTEKRVELFADSYYWGINSKDIILSKKDVFPPGFRIILPEVKASKNRQVIMSGTMIDTSSGVTSIYALSPEVTFIEINQLTTFDFRFVRDTELKGIGDRIEFGIDPQNNMLSNIVLDSRPKPIIYGPDAKSNKNKLKQWLS